MGDMADDFTEQLMTSECQECGCMLYEGCQCEEPCPVCCSSLEREKS